MFHHIDIRFPGTRKVRRCTVYPIKTGDTHVHVQSDDSIARISLIDGKGAFVVRPGGAYFVHLTALDAQLLTIDTYTLDRLRDIPRTHDGVVQLIGGK